METEKGKKVTIRFKCWVQDGDVYQVSDLDTLEFVTGAGTIPPALEKGLAGMKPGEHRTILVPKGETRLFPFPKEPHFSTEEKTPPGIAYEFGPGNGGDVSEYIPPAETRHAPEPFPAGHNLLFDVELLSID